MKERALALDLGELRKLEEKARKALGAYVAERPNFVCARMAYEAIETTGRASESTLRPPGPDRPSA